MTNEEMEEYSNKIVDSILSEFNDKKVPKAVGLSALMKTLAVSCASNRMKKNGFDKILTMIKVEYEYQCQQLEEMEMEKIKKVKDKNV